LIEVSLIPLITAQKERIKKGLVYAKAMQCKPIVWRGGKKAPVSILLIVVLLMLARVIIFN